MTHDGPDMDAFEIANARDTLSYNQFMAQALSDAEAATRPDLAASEQDVVTAHRQAADNGFRGAYPIPPVSAVDEWIVSQPYDTADTRSAAQVEVDVRTAGDDIERQLDLADEADEAASEDRRDPVSDAAQNRLREDAYTRGWDGVPGSMLAEHVSRDAATWSADDGVEL